MNHLHLADDTLIRAIDRELPPDDLAGVEAHWAECQRCRDRRARLVRAANDLANCYAMQEQAPGSRARLQSALTSRQAVRSPWFSGMPWRGAALAAAVVLLAILIRTTWTSATPDVANALPRASLTPGATWELSAADLCRGVRATRPITSEMRAEVLREYRMEGVPADQYELDYLITPELGGATDARNLWPQRYSMRPWNARVKDALETRLPELVCGNQITLESAQQEMAKDWIAAYRKYFDTDAPLPIHAALDPFDDDEEAVLWARAGYGMPLPKIRLVRVKAASGETPCSSRSSC